MVATPENTSLYQVQQLIKKAGAIIVTEPVFRKGTTGQDIDNKETYLWFRDERYFGLRLLCPERLPHHSHVRCPHRIVYFCTSLLTLYSPRVHIVCLLLRGVG